VRDLPRVQLVVREHRALQVSCPTCAGERGTISPEASSRAQYGPRLRALAVYLLEQHLLPGARVREVCTEVLGAPVSLGTFTGWVQKESRRCAPSRRRSQRRCSARPCCTEMRQASTESTRFACIRVPTLAY
jgi:transposase